MSKHNILHEEDHDYGFGVKFTKSELKEDENHFLEGFGNGLIVSAFLWTLVATGFLYGARYYDWMWYAFIFFLSIGGVSIAIWLALYLIPYSFPLIWKRLKSLPKQFVKWFFNLVES